LHRCYLMHKHFRLVFVAVPVLLLAELGCSSSVQPRSGVTLLVTNGTCTPGPCASLEILGFPATQAHTPGGFWSLDLGPITGPQACLTLPESAQFRIIGPADTATITWTTAVAMSLSALSPSSSRLMAAPSTKGFVPAAANGWRITLPGSSGPVETSACTV